VTAAEEPYELVVTPPAARALQTTLPEPVAAAVVEFLTGSLIHNPRRVGKPLRGDLAGVHSARRGTYLVLYRINDNRHEVVVVRIDHSRGAYRSQ
jgi:mRNA interferase RelE/StbE